MIMLKSDYDDNAATDINGAKGDTDHNDNKDNGVDGGDVENVKMMRVLM